MAVKGGALKLEVGNIHYIERLGRQLMFHTHDGIHASSATLQQMEEALADKGFIRCNKGYLVNLAHVSGGAGRLRRGPGGQAPHQPGPPGAFPQRPGRLCRGDQRMNQVYLSDIPRLFTAAAEWCACLVFMLNRPRRFDGPPAVGGFWARGWRYSACSST